MRLHNARAVGGKDPDLTIKPAVTSRAVTGLQARLELPPRIVHVAETIAGGIASFFEEIAPYQNQLLGAENVTFVIPAGSEVHLPSIAPSQIVTYAAGARGPRGLLAFGRYATAAVRRRDPDVVHLHSSFAGAVLRLALGRGKDRPRVIYCPHGWAFAIETSAGRKRIYAAIERWLTRRTDLVIANSETERELAISFGLPANKIRTIKNGIEWAPALPARTANHTPRRLRLAFVGRLDRQKGIDILLRTIERFPLSHIDFHIVGDSVLGDDLAARATAGANVVFHGWLSRANTMELLGDVDGLVMPSRWDAAPIVAIEAMRASLPVIGSDRGAIPEIVRDGVGGLIFHLDEPDSLGQLLQRINLTELGRLGQSARARWEADYTSERMNELTMEAYCDVLCRTSMMASATGRNASAAAAATENGRAA